MSAFRRSDRVVPRIALRSQHIWMVSRWPRRICAGRCPKTIFSIIPQSRWPGRDPNRSLRRLKCTKAKILAQTGSPRRSWILETPSRRDSGIDSRPTERNTSRGDNSSGCNFFKALVGSCTILNIKERNDTQTTYIWNARIFFRKFVHHFQLLNLSFLKMKIGHGSGGAFTKIPFPISEKSFKKTTRSIKKHMRGTTRLNRSTRLVESTRATNQSCSNKWYFLSYALKTISISFLNQL